MTAAPNWAVGALLAWIVLCTVGGYYIGARARKNTAGTVNVTFVTDTPMRWRRGNTHWHIVRPQDAASTERYSTNVICGTSVSGPFADASDGPTCERCLGVAVRRSARAREVLNYYSTTLAVES